MVSGEVPLETRQRLDDLAMRRPAFRTDLVREAIELLLARDLAA
jgi:predicted DNA-binding protein